MVLDCCVFAYTAAFAKNMSGSTLTAGPAYGIMMCGHTTPEVEAKWGDFGKLTQNLLEESGRQERWQIYNVCDDHFPTDAEFAAFKGIVITGSKADAFAQDPWIVKLRQLMAREANRGQQILGICFGAQLLSVALGGKAGRAECGWEAGSRPMNLLPAFFSKPYASSLPDKWQMNIHETHRDQILELPPGAELLATSQQTPLEIWQLGDNVLAVQGHPEFTVPFQKALNEYRLSLGTMSQEEKAIAEESMQRWPVTPENAKQLARVLKAFLDRGTA